MISQTFSTIGPLGVVIWQTLEDLGIAPEPLFADAGIEIGPLMDPYNRISDSAFRGLLTAIEEQPIDRVFGLHLGEVYPSNHFLLAGGGRLLQCYAG